MAHIVEQPINTAEVPPTAPSGRQARLTIRDVVGAAGDLLFIATMSVLVGLLVIWLPLSLLPGEGWRLSPDGVRSDAWWCVLVGSGITAFGGRARIHSAKRLRLPPRAGDDL